MKFVPAVRDLLPAFGRVLLWSFPLLFAGFDPRHGYDPVIKLLMQGPWVAVAVAGLWRNPARDKKFFYTAWLCGLIALELWRMFLPELVRTGYF